MFSKEGSITPREVGLYAYAGTLFAVAGGMAAGFAVGGLRGIYATVALCGVALLAERGSIRLSPAIEVTVASLPFILAGVLFGPLSAMIVAAAGLLVTFRPPYVRWAVWTGSRAIVAGASGVAAGLVQGGNGAASRSLVTIMLAAIAASLVEAIGDVLLGAIAPVIRGTGTLRESVSVLGPLALASLPFHAPVIGVLAYAYLNVSPWSVGLFAIPAFAAHRLFGLYRQQRDTAVELAAANRRLERANLSFATALVATLDARDKYTAGHSAAVAIYSRDIATRMGLAADAQQLVHLCGLVHDIGKVGLPAGLLEKPGALTLEERRVMETHSEIGERILSKVEDYSEIAAVVRHHHERVDGNGYPDGLAGDDIPLLSRIIAVADAYNAMTSDRPYREAMPSRVARLRLAAAVESQFDTSVVAAFEAILAGATEDYRIARGEQFVFSTQERDATLGVTPFAAVTTA